MTTKTQSILIGALVYVFLGVLVSLLAAGGGPGAVLDCLALLGSAMVAVWHYTSTNRLTILAGEGAGMGALVGLVGAVVGGLLGLLLVNLGIQPDPVDVMLEQFEAQGLTEEQIDQMMDFASLFAHPVLMLVSSALVGGIGGAIGGAIGAALFKKGGGAPEPPPL